MRIVLSIPMIVGMSLPALAQPPEPPPTRFGIAPQLLSYPQSTPQEALAAAIKVIEKERFEYLAAQLIDYKHLDTKVRDRARPLEKAVEDNLLAQRDYQRRDPVRFPPGLRLPDDPQAFAELVEATAQLQAFRLVVKDIRGTFREHPDHLKDFQKFLRSGNFTEDGNTASCTHRDIKNRAVYFKKVGEYWTIEDRQTANGTK